jgi:hypothetical protein
MRGRDGGKFPRTERGERESGKREGRKQFIQSFKALYGGEWRRKLLITAESSGKICRATHKLD